MSPFPWPSHMGVNPNFLYPSPIRDIAKPFLKIRDRADDWLVDTEKIAICGFSAGAHNCVMYSVSRSEPVITEFLGQPATAFKPAASTLAYRISDYHLMFGEIKDPFAQQLSNAAGIAFPGTTSPTKVLLDTVSPAGQLPVMLWKRIKWAKNTIPRRSAEPSVMRQRWQASPLS